MTTIIKGASGVPYLTALDHSQGERAMRFPVRLAVWALLLTPPAALADVRGALEKIKAVGPEGKGNEAAASAWKELVAQGTDALVPVLSAFEEARDRANNWLRAAVNAIAQDARKAKKPLPQKALMTFLNDQSNHGAARSLAFDLLSEMDPARMQTLLTEMTQDPSRELRRLAIELRLKQAEEADDKGIYARLLKDARDEDQVEAIVKALKKHGTEVDLATHYGFVMHWWLVAPFDNRKGIGFEKGYPPEEGVNLKGSYQGMNGETITWKQHSTEDPHGVVDLNAAIGKHKGAVAYAFAIISSPEEQNIDIRAGCINALKIYLNGEELFGREEYHHGMRLDQHNTRGTLKKGRNELLLKVCQNEQEENWAQKWQFQVRLCDRIGGAVSFTARKKQGEAK